MTIIDQYRAACPTCYNQWDGYIQQSGNTFGLSPSEARERMKSWALVWHEKPSPYRCPSCGSFDVEYRIGDPDVGDLDPLNDGQTNRPGGSELYELFSSYANFVVYSWLERKGVEPELREEKNYEISAALELILSEFGLIHQLEGDERNAKLLEMEKRIYSLA